MDIYQNLNDQQLAAVQHGNGPLLILAGAGSGKTRVLTTRIVHLIRNGLSPENILAVTFTNKAAQEMKHRILPFEPPPRFMGTFHSICMKILRRECQCLGFTSDFSIYDDQDQLSVIKDCLKEMGINEKMMSAKSVREQISRCKDELMEPRNLEDNLGDYGDTAFIDIYKRYQEKLKISNAMDFGDLIFQTVKLFRENFHVLESYQDRFWAVLVDEYQDTNTAQYQLIKFLSQKYQNVTVVGDPDQSIYEWRGANVQNIMNFEKDFQDATVIRLEQNYRSTNNILKAANGVIANNMNRKPKDLWSDNGDGEIIRLYKAQNERMEARFLVHQMQELFNEGYNLNEMVGFYRTHAQSRVIEEELRRCNIPYRIFGGLKFYSRKEVKDLLAYLKVIHNPGDEVSLFRVINTPKRGLGDAAIKKLRAFAQEKSQPLYYAVDEYARSANCSARNRKSFLSFWEMMEDIRQSVIPAQAGTQDNNVDPRDKPEDDNVLSVSRILEKVIEKTGYLYLLEGENTVEAKSRIENIKELVGSIQEFEMGLDDEAMKTSLAHFLEYISLQTDMDDYVEDDRIFTLMTLHSAKGLEFPIVFMLGVEEGILPHMNAVNGSETDIEEERRLCYVGMTRAMHRLYLMYANERKLYGRQWRQYPSRFLFEIPGELMHPRLNPMENRLNFSEVSS